MRFLQMKHPLLSKSGFSCGNRNHHCRMGFNTGIRCLQSLWQDWGRGNQEPPLVGVKRKPLQPGSGNQTAASTTAPCPHPRLPLNIVNFQKKERLADGLHLLPSFKSQVIVSNWWNPSGLQTLRVKKSGKCSSQFHRNRKLQYRKLSPNGGGPRTERVLPQDPPL